MSLMKVLLTSHVRDIVMSHLAPHDAANLINAVRLKLGPTDVSRYTSVFRYVFSSRRWVVEKTAEGYDFVLLSTRLENLTRSTTITRGRERVHIALLVAKDGKEVTCDRNLMPLSVFAAEESEYQVSDVNWVRPLKGSVITTRTVEFRALGVEVCVLCISSDLVRDHSPGIYDYGASETWARRYSAAQRMSGPVIYIVRFRPNREALVPAMMYQMPFIETGVLSLGKRIQYRYDEVRWYRIDMSAL